MKAFKIISTTLFALIYLIFGLNYFFHFIPMPPMTGDAGSFVGLLYTHQYLLFVKIIEIVTAVMLLINFKRALAWLLILPITVNILMFEILIASQPGIGILMIILNILGLSFHKEQYSHLLKD